MFYRPNEKRGPNEIKFWKSWKAGLTFYRADRAQGLDEKIRVICLVIIFTSRVIVIKMLKMAHFLYFLLMTEKNPSEFGQDI